MWNEASTTSGETVIQFEQRGLDTHEQLQVGVDHHRMDGLRSDIDNVRPRIAKAHEKVVGFTEAKVTSISSFVL